MCLPEIGFFGRWLAQLRMNDAAAFCKLMPPMKVAARKAPCEDDASVTLPPMNLRLLPWCLCVVLSLAVATSAYAASGEDDFERGVAAAAAGDDAAALQYFKQAEQAGLDTVALKYNLAVSYYRLQQYEAARKIFAELADVPSFEQLAYFNLGLIANQQKDEAEAIAWFRRAYRNPGSEKLRKLSAIALDRLGASVDERRREDKRWTGLVSSSLTHDSNVALANDELVGVTSESDTAADISVSAGRWLKGTINSGVRMALGASLRKFGSLSQNDDAQLSARVLRYDRLADWRVRLGGSWDEIYFDGSGYQRIVSADVRALKNLSSTNQLRLRYKLSRIQATDAVFDYLDGWRQQLRIGLQQRGESLRLRYYYQLELNSREDRVGSFDPFISYSPTRHSLRASSWWDFAGQWQAQLDARFRYSRYNDDNILNGGITERREDSQLRLSARLSRSFARHWEAHTQFTAITNESNVDLRSYDRSIIKAGVSRLF